MVRMIVLLLLAGAIAVGGMAMPATARHGDYTKHYGHDFGYGHWNSYDRYGWNPYDYRAPQRGYLYEPPRRYYDRRWDAPWQPGIGCNPYGGYYFHFGW